MRNPIAALVAACLACAPSLDAVERAQSLAPPQVTESTDEAGPASRARSADTAALDGETPPPQSPAEPSEIPVEVNPLIEPGVRVRLHFADTKDRLAGRVVAVDDEVVILDCGRRWKPVRVERAAITRVETSLKRHGHGGAGAGLGLLVLGLPLGMVGGFAGYVADNGGIDCNPCSESGAGVGMVLGFGAAAAIGAGIGALIKTDQWQDAAPARVRLSVAPMRRGGVRVALSLGF